MEKNSVYFFSHTIWLLSLKIWRKSVKNSRRYFSLNGQNLCYEKTAFKVLEVLKKFICQHTHTNTNTQLYDSKLVFLCFFVPFDILFWIHITIISHIISLSWNLRCILEFSVFQWVSENYPYLGSYWEYMDKTLAENSPNHYQTMGEFWEKGIYLPLSYISSFI